MIPDKEELFKTLNSTGEEDVRVRLAQGTYGQHREPLVKEWLRAQKDDRLKDTESRRESREEETLAIAKQANEIAQEALRSNAQSKIAAWVAAVAAIIAAIAALVERF